MQWGMCLWFMYVWRMYNIYYIKTDGRLDRRQPESWIIGGGFWHLWWKTLSVFSILMKTELWWKTLSVFSILNCDGKPCQFSILMKAELWWETWPVFQLWWKSLSVLSIFMKTEFWWKTLTVISIFNCDGNPCTYSVFRIVMENIANFNCDGKPCLIGPGLWINCLQLEKLDCTILNDEYCDIFISHDLSWFKLYQYFCEIYHDLNNEYCDHITNKQSLQKYLCCRQKKTQWWRGCNRARCSGHPWKQTSQKQYQSKLIHNYCDLQSRSQFPVLK